MHARCRHSYEVQDSTGDQKSYVQSYRIMSLVKISLMLAMILTFWGRNFCCGLVSVQSTLHCIVPLTSLVLSRT